MRALVLAALTCTILSAAATKEFSRTVPLDAGGRFSLDTYKGSINITGWDRRDVEIKARIQEDPGWMSMSVEDVEIRVDATPSNVRVKSDYHHRRGIFNMEGSLPFVHYTIRVPRSCLLSVKDYKSESDVSGIEGEIEFETYRGTARLNGLRSAFNLNTHRGEVRATFDAFTKRSHIESYRGRIELILPRNAAFDLEGDIGRHGDLDCDFARTLRSSRRDRDFQSKVNGGGPALKIKSYRGNIRVRGA